MQSLWDASAITLVQFETPGMAHSVIWNHALFHLQSGPRVLSVDQVYCHAGTDEVMAISSPCIYLLYSSL